MDGLEAKLELNNRPIRVRTDPESLRNDLIREAEEILIPIDFSACLPALERTRFYLHYRDLYGHAVTVLPKKDWRVNHIRQNLKGMAFCHWQYPAILVNVFKIAAETENKYKWDIDRAALKRSIRSTHKHERDHLIRYFNSRAENEDRINGILQKSTAVLTAGFAYVGFNLLSGSDPLAVFHSVNPDAVSVALGIGASGVAGYIHSLAWYQFFDVNERSARRASVERPLPFNIYEVLELS